MTTNTRQVNGLIELFYRWHESNSGYQDETIDQTVLRVEGENLTLEKRHEYIGYGSGRTQEITQYSISPELLTQLIIEHGTKVNPVKAEGL